MGKISVNIQREDRLRAIVELSVAVRKVAEALITPVRVNITGCNIKSSGVGINVATEDEVDVEEIIETE